VLFQPGFHQHVRVRFILYAGNRLNAASSINITYPAIMRCAAIAIVCKPDEQKRFTVMPLVVTGLPPRNAILTGDIAASRTFRCRTPHDDIFHFR
jgi:hypothetical protein